ncbi:hypothetical protein EW026_g4603 [Hermanssonia centrifuga]|uniref:Aminoacyl-tRNA synthetase class I anticodon-binding domain-containing protein n=1 Tax=Hermanssonia centrifuga TaxID=98765 RepID=A0A4S4KHQ5_9APHY|nr:hypothetical protein EW026_g4603 [Hermanssonia centrifuga]
MMSLSEMIRDFDLTSITHRRSVLDPEKLRYLNQHHLMQEISTSDGLEKSAERSHDTVKVAFPLSQYTTVPYIKEIIRGLEGRVMNLYDIPALAPYFFERPDLGSMEANSLLKNIPEKHYLAALDGVLVGLQALDIWDSQTLHDLLFAKIDSLGITQKAFMFSLRYALTGMKSGPSIADIMRILGRERTIERIQAAKDLANPEHVEQA